MCSRTTMIGEDTDGLKGPFIIGLLLFVSEKLKLNIKRS